MSPEARRALATIRDCIESERFALSFHFQQRMQRRALFWPDVQAVLDDPEDVRSEGMDKYNRPKWIIGGEAAGSGEIEIVCAIETTENDIEFLTIYWED